ncbi:Forkhead-associated domain-containing protein [Salix suchowensis]|nr:Forkhead-associated domain-containing protein [Salix suchowensis]
MAAISATATTSVITTTSIPLWIPEDDLLLKNAIEAGASLEALAKGAVRFSRKFSVRELSDRWHSLLYDNDVSAEASSRMVELHLSNFSLPKLNTITSSSSSKFGFAVKESDSVKRKFECVRQLYYAMRKKMRKRGGEGCGDFFFLHSLDGVRFGFVGGNEGGEGDVCIERENVRKDAQDIEDGLVECQDSERSEAPGSCDVPESDALIHAGRIESLAPRVPLGKGMEDVSAPKMPSSVNVEGKGHKSDFPDISDSLLNFPNDDDPLFIDVNGKDAIVKACYDSITTSLLVNSPNDVQGDVPDVKDPVISASDTSLGIPDGACPAELEVIAEESHSVGGNKDIHSVSEMDTPPSSSVSAPKILSAEENDVEMECTLNMEDFEIPCNDDVFIGKTIASPIKEQTSNMTHNLPSSRINKKDCKQEVILLKKEEIPAQCRTSPQIVGCNMLPVTNPRCQPVCSDAECDSRALISRSVITTHVEPSEGGAALGSPTSSTIGLPKSGSLHEKLSLPIKVISVPSTSNQEESGSDDDVPSFSDIEAMILEMDLCPDDSDSFNNHEVSRYQNEDAMRAIIRLEQCAQSSMQRAIASRGALAVLYGRHLKHYIKDTLRYVMLGRATEDMDVDIDLGREGPANKISRRQALIKMEGDGSFFLKNLGKSPMFLNGKELTSGQSMGLRSSSLIEIREMAFVFEVNRKSVTRHLVSVIKNHKENNFKSKWSDKGVNHREADFKFEWAEGIP